MSTGKTRGATSLQRLVQLSLIAACSVGGVAAAQTPAGPSDEEVVVTAQRRAQNVIDVPLSVGVLSPEITTAFGVTEVNNLALVTPSLTLNGSSGVAGEGFRVRGIGGSTLADGVEQSVSVLVDDVVTGSSGSGLLEFWDVDRIEILRGPQGTLFGKNASAGVIAIHNRRPGDSFEAGIAAEYSPTFEETRIDYHVGGPVSEAFGLRLAGFYAKRGEGYVDNPIRNTTENRGERWGARLGVNWQLGDVSVDGSIEVSQQDLLCCARTFSFVDPATAGGTALSNLFLARIAANGVQPSLDNLTSIADAPITHTNDVIHAVLRPTWNLSDGAEIRSITGYRSWEQVAITDSDVIDVDLANRFDIRRDMDIFSQEVQYISPQGRRLEYLLGVYYFHQWFDVDSDLGSATFLTGGIPQRTLQRAEVQSENAAIYGHATYAFTERWSAFAGARILRDNIEVDFVSNGNFFFFPTGPRSGQASASDSNWTGTIGLQYHPTDNAMLYVSASRGYKGPAIDVGLGGGGIANPNADPTLNPEIVANFEIGSKGSYFDGRLRFDAVVFYSDVTDFQATAFDPQSATFILRNAGEVSSRGVEIDVTAMPTDALQLYLNIAYTDATFEEFNGAPCTVPQVVALTCSNAVGQSLSGRRVNQTPEWALSLGGRYDFSIGDVPVYARGDASWQDEMISDLDLDPNTRIPARWVANFEIGVTPNERTRLALWARNAFDEQYTTRILDAAAFRGGYVQFPAIGRRIGVTLAYDY